MKRMKGLIYSDGSGKERKALTGSEPQHWLDTRSTGDAARVSCARVALAAVEVPQLDASEACPPAMLASFKDGLPPHLQIRSPHGS